MAQQRPAEPAPYELRRQPEISDLTVTAIGTIKLVVAGNCTSVVGNPRSMAILLNECLPIGVMPGIKIAPFPGRAYELVEEFVE
ncbi:hypothetical protein PSEG_02054 [Pseudomonas sp. Nvir]|nr:hypothetical protein PSNVIR_00127 [Pseudomonas sp. Nvir]SUD77903.1 Uncharacterised protein [Pseudomonas putida]